jgi:hypothetical protein
MNRRSFFATLFAAPVAVIAAANLRTPEVVRPRLDAVSVIVPPRKLKCGWTMKSANDLRAVHGLEAEKYVGDLVRSLTSESREQLKRSHPHLDLDC